MAHESSPARGVDQEVARITASCATRLQGIAPAELEAAVWAEFACRSDATIKDYVPVFVERSVRSRYGIATTT